MTLQHNIYAAIASLGLLASCSSDIFAPAYTVGEADNAIVLHAGISEGGAGVMTRATGSGVLTRAAGGYDDIDNANHAKHHTFAEGTKAALRIDGDWWKQGDDHATPISQTTTATIGAETATDSKHNTLTMSPQRYWDDYGTADPANIDAPTGTATADTGGRNKGLTIYGVAVDGKTTLPTTPTNLSADVLSWNALAWNVGTPEGTPLALSQTDGWSDYDLLVSNNVKDGGLDGTYKFDEKSSGKLLEFTHAMTKVTVNLTAGEGFPGYTTAPANAKFQAAPTVTLLGFNYTGTVNVETKTSTPTTTTNITAYRDAGADWADGGQHQTQFTALVFPGNTFSDATDILKIVADGNTYYVNATKINAVNTEASNTFEQGKNYIFNIIISKTDIVVTATVKNWIDVEADTETPKINVTANVGAVSVDENTKQRMPSFDFYLSDAAGGSASTAYTKSATATAPTEGADGATAWTFNTPLYWPNHTTHYLMRGVSPTSTTVAAGKIAVAADDYSAEATAAGNLLVGAPVITSGTMCGNTDHTQVDMASGGICAREGKINLTFDYMMSQLEVHLTTSSDAAAVNLTKAKVEVVGGYTIGEVDIHAKTTTATGAMTDFTVNYITGEDDNYRHSFVVPQTLSYTAPRATSNLRFKVTIYKDGDPEHGIDDIYYADIKPIQVSIAGGEKQSITEWQHGKHYIYVLDINKTAINTTATITDWVTVTASDTVWF